MELAARELQVCWLWQDQLLAVEQQARGVVRIGPGTRCDVLPDARAPFDLARWDVDGWTVRVPAGTRGTLDDGHVVHAVGQPRVASELQLGDRERATIDFGTVRAELCWADRPRRAGLDFQERLDWRFLYLLVTTAFAFGMIVVTGTLTSTEPDDIEGPLLRSPVHLNPVAIRPPPPVVHTNAPAEHAPPSPASTPAPAQAKAAAPGAGHRGRAQATQLVRALFGGSVLSGMLGTEGLGPGMADALSGMGRGRSGIASGTDGLDLRGGPPSGMPGQTIGVDGLSTHHGSEYGPGTLCHGTQCKDQLGPTGITSDHGVVQGSMDRELIRSVIHRNRAQIRYCYEQTLIGSPNLAGRAEVHFVIGAEGNVLRADVASSTTHVAALDACIASKFRGWIFPKPKGGGVVDVTYPVVLQRSGAAGEE